MSYRDRLRCRRCLGPVIMGHGLYCPRHPQADLVWLSAERLDSLEAQAEAERPRQGKLWR